MKRCPYCNGYMDMDEGFGMCAHCGYTPEEPYADFDDYTDKTEEAWRHGL